MRPRYRYSVVTSCGAGVYSKPLSHRRALRALARLMREHPEIEDWELERQLEVARSAYRYWLRRRGKWRVYGSDPLIHQPTAEDFSYWRDRAMKEEG